MPEIARQLYEHFIALLKPFRETNLTTTEDQVIWLFASDRCKLEVTFDMQRVAHVIWHVETKDKYDFALTSNVSLSLTDDTKIQELVALVKPVHDAIAQERAYDTLRHVFGK